MPFNIKTLQNQALLNKLSAPQKKALNNAVTEITQLRKQIKDKNALKSNPVVKTLIREQIAPLTKANQALTTENKSLKATLASPTKLKSLPAVKQLLEKETTPLQKNIEKLLREREQLIKKLELLGKVKRLPKQNFNKFIADSVRELQTSLRTSDPQAEDEFIIRDVEIEATVLTEEVNGTPTFSLPTREDLKELSGERMQKLKYSLIVVPRDIT